MLNKGNIAVFALKDQNNAVIEYKIGEVRIVDAWIDSASGVRQVSYDIFVMEENRLYKHIPHHQVNTLPAFVVFLRMMKLPEEYRVRAISEVVSSLESDFDINDRDSYGNTVLHIANILKRPDLVKLAIEMGAFKYLNNDGDSQYELARRYECGKSIDMLKNLLGPHPLGIKCQKCGRFVDNKSKYCPWCKEKPNFNGSKRTEPDYDLDETMSFCYKCGAPVRFAHTYCAICGEKLK